MCVVRATAYVRDQGAVMAGIGAPVETRTLYRNRPAGPHGQPGGSSWGTHPPPMYSELQSQPTPVLGFPAGSRTARQRWHRFDVHKRILGCGE